MNTRTTIAIACCLMITVVKTVSATMIQYDVANISGNTWEYSYTVNNDTLGIDIDEFTVYFDSGDYTNLSLPSAPGTWDPLAVQPDNFMNNNGFYDALALSGGIAAGISMGGFSVRFDYLGAGTPGSQLFEIVDPSDFSILDSGQTSVIPVPPAIWLFIAGGFGLFRFARITRR